MREKNKNSLKGSEVGYDKAETELLREALKRTYKERFLMLTRLYKIQQTLNKAKITYRNPSDGK